MGISAAGVGIHGTNTDTSIGYSISHGCIRMHVPEAEWLFQRVELGRNGLDGQPEGSRRQRNFKRAGTVARRKPTSS
jgi:hypothetical protein